MDIKLSGKIQGKQPALEAPVHWAAWPPEGYFVLVWQGEVHRSALEAINPEASNTKDKRRWVLGAEESLEEETAISRKATAPGARYGSPHSFHSDQMLLGLRAVVDPGLSGEAIPTILCFLHNLPCHSLSN